MSADGNSLRERWLRDTTELLRPFFKERGYEIPPVVHLSVGWPARGGANGKSLGECWDPSRSADGASHVFVTPKLGPDEVGHVLVHELLHAVMFARYPGKKIAHGKIFKKGCEALGLEGKPTATVASATLLGLLAGLAQQTGPYPHSILTPELKEKKTRKAWAVVCACVPRRVFKGSQEDVKGPPLTCAGCGKELAVERIGGDEDDEPEDPPEDPGQLKIFTDNDDSISDPPGGGTPNDPDEGD